MEVMIRSLTLRPALSRTTNIQKHQPQGVCSECQEYLPSEAEYCLGIVPYPSNPDFVGRSKILEELKDSLGHKQGTSGTSQPRVSLFGLGGVG